MTTEKRPVHRSLIQKRGSRIAAVQCLYTRAINDEKLEPATLVMRLKARLKNNAEEQRLVVGSPYEPHYPLLTDLLEGVIKWESDINACIDKHLRKDWKRDRLGPVQLSILQCGLFELLYYKDSKAAVVVDAYTSVTRAFLSEKEVQFVHGLLAAVAKAYDK